MILALVVTLAAVICGLAFAIFKTRRALSESVRASNDRIAAIEKESVDLRESLRRAEAASVAKSDFLASVSHEMRTPLHGILGMLQLTGDSEPTAERREQLRMASRSAESLLATIEDILDFTKIEARKLELEPVYFSIRELVTDTMKTLGVTATQKGLQFAFTMAADVPDRLWGDPLRLRQIIINLVGNAIKFTNSGEIVMRGWAEMGFGSDVTLHLEVRDTGMGIDPHKRKTIFDPFAQADSSHSRRYGGTGLGLSIVGRLVEAMGGNITFESEIGKGSAFHVAVKLAYDTIAGMVPPQWHHALSGMRVMVIEPHAATREILGDVLITHGMVPELYASVADALQPSIREQFSSVVIDATVLASTPWISPVPVVQIVSPLSTMIHPTVTVTRPVGERELVEAVAVSLGIIERRMSFTLERRIDIDRPQTVLVVDDHPVNLEFAAEALRRLGHSVATAANGTEALRLLQARSFDVALVDVQMPDMDGFEVARRLRAVERTHHTRLIALTAYTAPEDRDRCIASGMDGVLTKPLTQNRLAAVLRGQSPEPDGDTILEAVGGNVKLLARVRDAFTSQSPRLIDAMRDAIAQRNADILYRSAHTLKGAISNFGMGEALDAAIQIERAGRDADFARASTLLPTLEAAVRELEDRMSATLAAAQSSGAAAS
ncbi:MAG: response regulator [Acidobacteriota bacterium]|nr:response regulator [Acidobacteriota bacterium]